MGNFEREHTQRRELCWSRSGCSRLTLSLLYRLPHHRPANNEQNVSLPSGRWEVCRRGWHVHCQLSWSRSGSSRLTLCLPRLRHHHPANNERNVSLPSGRWEIFKVAAARTFCSCAKESRGKSSSGIFPSGQWTIAGLCGTYRLLLTKASAAVVQE
jgi:hypothetical protein